METIVYRCRCRFDKEININASEIEPMITYGTNPGLGIGINGIDTGNRYYP
jgi:homoaconitase/3-isopropylmalate dehydratase large subunit